LISEEIDILAKEDFLDVFNVIHIANCNLKLSEMRVMVARTLKRDFKAQGVAFFLCDKEFRRIDNTNIVGAGMNLRYLDQWIHHYCHYDPFQQEARSKSTVCKVDDILPYKRWVTLPIYNEFYRPQNIHYKLSIYLRSNDRVFGLIGMFRPKEHPDFSKKEIAKARILASHLTTALENNIRFSEMQERKNLWREETLSEKYQLTKREIDIVRCVCQGLTNDEIGRRLYISRFTVETHLKNIFYKTSVKHRAGLASLLQSPCPFAPSLCIDSSRFS
jgi:DNA-binding CsgD family transcriptional regulator